ncbi:MAG: hypothetical protein KIS62_10820 [Ramlibacter sp.]|nr:hypothetical protein [Ramlibacter sp.]
MTPRRPSRLLIAGVWGASFAAVCGLVALVLIAVAKVESGQGLDTYRTYWLVGFNWTGLLVLLIATSIALVAGFILKFKERSEWHLHGSRHSANPAVSTPSSTGQSPH